MNKDILVFNDGTEIFMEAGANLGDIRIVSQSKEEMIFYWNKFTNENISKIQIKNGNGITVGKYENLLLESETSIVQYDGTILTSYRLRRKTNEEIHLDALEEWRDIQSGAIADLGEITSSLAEGMERSMI